ncbi:MAG: DUF3488 and transglutaminase-like domain-containing protein [Pyrinomonadaceae bacterium]
MSFDKLFIVLSYAAVFCGFFSLWISGTFGMVGTGLFVSVVVAGWFLEGSRWQISERVGTALVVLAMPLFYLGWKFQLFGFVSSEAMVAGILARLILSLTASKILQKKSDRDWIFLYLMAFFEVLLAAGLSISAMYLFSFVGYVFIMTCTIILFEIKKSDQATNEKSTARVQAPAVSRLVTMPIRRLPRAAVALILFIILLAAPMFFLLPRVGSAGIGGNNGSVSTSSGFSDTVTLGGVGNIQQNDEVVMRVRIENAEEGAGNLRWRGIALDTFNNHSWSRTKAAPNETKVKGERELIQVDYATGRESLTLQTIYLEPLDRPVLFGLSRAVGVQGNFPVLFKDIHGAITFPRVGERISYKVLSDRTLPDTAELRSDRSPYSEDEQNYLQLPETLDKRIAELSLQITGNKANRLDSSLAIESYLQNSFGYTLEQKAGGDEPLADFLFNVREGHCEYFATAMAMMLRTQGIATRIVNGFQQGEYNETADVYVVRQRHAHSWVEVYFPGEDAWVPFDPTPYGGRLVDAESVGISGQAGKYLEALETFWIQYFVAFDNQEQRSLFTSVRKSVGEYQSKTSSWLGNAQEGFTKWWTDVRGDKGVQARAVAVGYGAAYLTAAVFGVLLLLWLYRCAVKFNIWSRLSKWLKRKNSVTVIEFYERMQTVLASKGLTREPHQTPLEFAFALNIPEVVRITEKYNRVRFGEKYLSSGESNEIEIWLENLEATKKHEA